MPKQPQLEGVTLRWLIENLPLRTWYAIAGLLVLLLGAAFSLGASRPIRDVSATLAEWLRTRGVADGGASVNPAEPTSDDRLDLTIENIEFGVRQIPDAYENRHLSPDEISQLLAPLRESDERITLTDDEASSLNAIADASNQAALSPVASNRAYDMTRIASLFEPGFSFYYEYTQWETVARTWSDLFKTTDQTASEVLRSFVSLQHGQPDSPGIFSGLAAMATIEGGDGNVLLSLMPEEGDCGDPGATNVRLVTEPGGLFEPDSYFINWGRYASPISISVPFDREARVMALSALVELFANACVETLGRVLETASKIYGEEHALMKRYIDEWNGILQTRDPGNLRVTVTMSNRGMEDAYVRGAVRAAVGSRGEGGKILLTLTHDADLGDSSPANHLAVAARASTAFVFNVALDSQTSQRLHGAFTSGLNFVQVGALVLRDNQVAYSPVTPFSDAARREALETVNNIEIQF